METIYSQWKLSLIQSYHQIYKCISLSFSILMVSGDYYLCNLSTYHTLFFSNNKKIYFTSWSRVGKD